MLSVETVGLCKRFGNKEALTDVSIAVEEATVLGLLGPNGAGKTTMVRILSTLMLPDAGQAFIDGIDVVAEPHKARARIGLTGQYAAVDERMSARENISYVGQLYHLAKKKIQSRTEELIEHLDLADAADNPAKTYSGGMRRKLDIAMSLVAQPSVLFLDEPTTGLDPRSRTAMWSLISDLVQDGTTTLLTTQYLEEADQLADRITVVDHGKVIAEGTPEDLKQRMGGGCLEVEVHNANDIPITIDTLQQFCAPDYQIFHTDKKITLPVDSGGSRLLPQVIRAIDAAGVLVDDVGIRQPTLDDVFLNLTGHHAVQTSDEIS